MFDDIPELVNDIVDWWNAFIEKYINCSTLAAAEFPAIVTAPKEFMEDWINTLERENNIPWKPAGKPILSIS